MDIKSAVVALSALAQDSRLAIYRTLVQAGPQGMSAGKIGESVGIPPSSLSFHMKELSFASLVKSRQEGRFVIYSANFEVMNALLAFMTENCCGGNTPLSVSCPISTPAEGRVS
ncbi:MAG: metalloregulator ArsR/SmtB family transcription factor [Methylococcales bacterium]|nr:metalloregulator ArsR/SmtB family transcription factor [Methylococcales bacterium]